jgi:hypothetical protein
MDPPHPGIEGAAMSQRVHVLVGAAAAFILSVAGAAVRAQAPPAADHPGAVKNYTPPKTPWGDPDLQGIWPGIELVGVPLQRQESFGTRNWLTDEEFKQRQVAADRQAAQALEEIDVFTVDTSNAGAVGSPTSPPPHWLERGTPQYIASLIVDPPNGRQPPQTTEAQQRAQAAAAARKQAPPRGPADSYTDRSLYDRCITRGIAGSFLPVIYNNGNEIVQGPGWVALRNEMIHETRIVPLDGRAKLVPSVTSYMGDSRGRWEGNTLVVETTNFNDRAPGVGANGGGRVAPDFKVIEHITRVAPDLLIWDMTFESAQTWARPWTIRLPLKLDNGYIMAEYACHEGNYAMFNILSGARADERAAADAAAKGLSAPSQGGGRGGRGGRGGAQP